MIGAKTKEELRAEFMDAIRQTAAFWSNVACSTERERCDGVAFSILTMIDGCRNDMPAIDLVMRPHPDDKEFHQSEGDDWVEDGTVINDDVHLHDLFYQRMKT